MHQHYQSYLHFKLCFFILNTKNVMLTLITNLLSRLLFEKFNISTLVRHLYLTKNIDDALELVESFRCIKNISIHKDWVVKVESYESLVSSADF